MGCFMNKKNALLVFGGKSFEHDISIITALIIYNNAKETSYNFIPLYINKNNEWFFYAGNKLNISYFKNFDKEYKKNDFKKVSIKIGSNFIEYKDGFLTKKIPVDVALNCCHGGMGEDGSLTAILENCNIPVSSGGHTSMGVCMKKLLSKYVFLGDKIQTIKHTSFTKFEFESDLLMVQERVFNLGYPVILKPNNLGSSIGIEVVKSQNDFVRLAKVALEFDDTILVEKAILDGMTEYNIACLKIGNEIKVSMLDKPIKSEEILSFKDKYIGEENNSLNKNNFSKLTANKMCRKNKLNGEFNGEYLGDKKDFPADVPNKILKTIQDVSIKIYRDLELEGPVRIDYILDRKNKIYLNEINTVPGSLAYYFFIPSLFKNMSEFIDQILNNAIQNYREKIKVKKEYLTKII